MAVDTDELRRLAHELVDPYDGSGDEAAVALVAAADEIDRLRRWKAEAIEVLSAWDEVHRVLGSPARPGQSIAAASKAEVMRLSDEIDRLRAAIETHRSEFYGANDYDMAPTRSDEALWAALGEGDET